MKNILEKCRILKKLSRAFWNITYPRICPGTNKTFTFKLTFSINICFRINHCNNFSSCINFAEFKRNFFKLKKEKLIYMIACIFYWYEGDTLQSTFNVPTGFSNAWLISRRASALVIRLVTWIIGHFSRYRAIIYNKWSAFDIARLSDFSIVFSSLCDLINGKRKDRLITEKEGNFKFSFMRELVALITQRRGLDWIIWSVSLISHVGQQGRREGERVLRR